MEAVIEVDETDVTRISVGDSASVQIDAFPDTSFAGTVTKIGNSSIRPRQSTAGSQDQAIDFEVRITLDDPPPGIRPDLSATADVITATRSDVLAIPIIALTLEPAEELPEGWRDSVPEDVDVTGDRELEGVFLIRGETARFRPVRVGITGDNYFEVLAGLSAGDTVVAGSYQAIRELAHGSRLDVGTVASAPDPDESPSPDTSAPEGAESVDEGGGTPEADGAASSRPADDAAASGVDREAVDASAGGPFHAVVISARDSGGVRALLDELEADGWSTMVGRHRDDAGNTWYRGLVGPYGARAEAESAARRLRESHDLEVWVAGPGTTAQETGGGSAPEA
jgi:hypothetical protein